MIVYKTLRLRFVEFKNWIPYMKYHLLLAFQLVSFSAMAAVTTSFENGNLTIRSNADDPIVVSGKNGDVLLNDEALGVETANVRFIRINGGPDDNNIDTTGVTIENGFTHQSLRVDIRGGDGDDTITSGPTGSSLDGGAGTDSLIGGEGRTLFSWSVGEGGSDTIDGSLCTYSEVIYYLIGNSFFDSIDASVSVQMNTMQFTSGSDTVSATDIDVVTIVCVDGNNEVTFSDLSSANLSYIQIFPGGGADLIDASSANTQIRFVLEKDSFNSTYFGSASQNDSLEISQFSTESSITSLTSQSSDFVMSRSVGSTTGTLVLRHIENVGISASPGPDQLSISDLSSTHLKIFQFVGLDGLDRVSMVGSQGVEFYLSGNGFRPEAGVIDELIIDAEMRTVTEGLETIEIGGKGLIRHQDFESIVINNRGADLTDIWITE